mmetsp:Transcript_51323/g.164085  ORF Transcript_51323/g.164085 Transcript_51323/m.164085 type:complete len:200 (+) Transcript_51323:721-1320(+)
MPQRQAPGGRRRRDAARGPRPRGAAAQRGRRGRGHPRLVPGRLRLPGRDDQTHQGDPPRPRCHRRERGHRGPSPAADRGWGGRPSRRHGIRIHLHHTGGVRRGPRAGHSSVAGRSHRPRHGRAHHRRRRDPELRPHRQGPRPRGFRRHVWLALLRHPRGARRVLHRRRRRPREEVPRNGVPRRHEEGERHPLPQHGGAS